MAIPKIQQLSALALLSPNLALAVSAQLDVNFYNTINVGKIDSNYDELRDILQSIDATLGELKTVMETMSEGIVRHDAAGDLYLVEELVKAMLQDGDPLMEKILTHFTINVLQDDEWQTFGNFGQVDP